jgi:hypothetical protein
MDDAARQEQRTKIRAAAEAYGETGDRAPLDGAIRDYADAGGSVEDIAWLAGLTREQVREILASGS